MTTRIARIVYRPLDGWPYPQTAQQLTPFSSPWPSTTDLLLREADHLNARLVIVELDVSGRAVRLDEQLRSDARPASEKVRISMETSRGALSWHTNRYRLPMGGALGWRENVRAIALTLEALRSAERYGAVQASEQYRGFAAIEAGPATGFASADEALRWIVAKADSGSDLAAGTAYKYAARKLHPDVGGDPAEWARLDEARRLLETAGVL